MYEDENSENEWGKDEFEIIQMVSDFEKAIKNQQAVFFDHDKYEQIIDFYEDNHKKESALQ